MKNDTIYGTAQLNQTKQSIAHDSIWRYKNPRIPFLVDARAAWAYYDSRAE